MNIDEAIEASQIRAARGYNEQDEPVVSVAFYGGKLVMNGWQNNWKWRPIDEETLALFNKELIFKPYGIRSDDDIEDSILDALTDIYEDDDDFVPIGDMPDAD